MSDWFVAMWPSVLAGLLWALPASVAIYVGFWWLAMLVQVLVIVSFCLGMEAEKRRRA